MIWQVLNIETLQSEYFEKLSDLVRKYNFTESTVRNKWSSLKPEVPNELERFIIIEKYRITKVQVN
jgi:hypothetical protein